MKLKITILLMMSATISYSQLQRKTSYNDLVWFGYFSKAALNEKWSIYFDFGLRRTEWLNKWSQTLVRPGITYSLNKNISITMGVAYFNHYTASCIRPEYRGWEQVLFTESYGRIKVNHRLRLEQRLNQVVFGGDLIDEYNYNNRYRYQLGLQIALNRSNIENKTLYLSLTDEIMLNSGKEIAYNYFDQNRLSLGVGYKLNELFNLTVSYMAVFIQRSQPGMYERNNAVVINAYHTFNFFRKKNNEH